MSQTWFVGSVFSNVASEDGAKCWAGRPAMKEALIKLRRSFVRMPESTLDLMWANLGAGKTHTLLYLQRCLQTESPATVSAFVEMPEQISSFLDLYRRIAGALPLSDVASAILSSNGSKRSSVFRAANVLVNGGEEEQRIVREWLLGGRPTLRELKQCSGISERIEDDLSATDVLCAICAAFAKSQQRLVLLVDEYQRVGVLKPQARDRVLSSLRTVFSRSPTYLSAVLSVHSMVEENARAFVPPELQTLIGRRPTLALSAMDASDAKEFILGRFKCFRAGDFAGAESAPFAQDAIPAVVDFMQGETHGALTPRELLQTFGYIYGQTENPDEGIATEEALRLAADLYGHA